MNHGFGMSGAQLTMQPNALFVFEIILVFENIDILGQPDHTPITHAANVHS